MADDENHILLYAILGIAIFILLVIFYISIFYFKHDYKTGFEIGGNLVPYQDPEGGLPQPPEPREPPEPRPYFNYVGRETLNKEHPLYNRSTDAPYIGEWSPPGENPEFRYRGPYPVPITEYQAPRIVPEEEEEEEEEPGFEIGGNLDSSQDPYKFPYQYTEKDNTSRIMRHTYETQDTPEAEKF